MVLLAPKNTIKKVNSDVLFPEPMAQDNLQMLL